MSIVSWAGTVLVLLILLAFFWPQGKKSTLEVTSPEFAQKVLLGETDLSAAEQSELIKSEGLDSSLSFSRENDLDRAGEYRANDARDLKIRSLLDQAKIRISKGQLLKPANASALDSYNAVLAISPDNPSAKEGLDYLKSRFMSAGYSALAKDKVSVAQTALASIEKIEAGSDESYEFSGAIDRWKIAKTVEEFLGKAVKALKNQNTILPARENALYFYQQALTLAPDNEAAIKGIKRIADTFVGKTNAAVVEGDVASANAHLATLSLIDSAHESIPALESAIERAKEIQATQVAINEAQADIDTTQADIKTAQSGATIATEPLLDTPEDSIVTASAADVSNRQSSEQEAFDKQYLKQGLEAYYQGDYGDASSLLQPLADKGVARAQFRLAYMYYLGRGFVKNTKTADTMIRAALPAIQKFANEGRAWAQSDLGSLYEDGLVLPKDYRDAVKWYSLAAKQGYPGAQTNLGIMYARGRGVVASRRTAIQWFQRAAKQGDEVAKRNLAVLGIKE